MWNRPVRKPHRAQTIENASLKKWLCIKIRLWVKIVEIPSFPPRHRRGWKILSINSDHHTKSPGSIFIRHRRF
ncbi:MAG: hypothetical protein LBR79_04540 [Oscillospiraceae bacterium]|nr:hypothetical protein [Oscillospiraceae bacterium]